MWPATRVEFRNPKHEIAYRRMSRSRSFIAAEAIREYVALNDWQIAEIKKGIAEADRGDFASDAEVERTLRKWTGRRAR